MNLGKAFKLSMVLAAIFAFRPTHAFQEDYVWQERFKTQLPLAESGDAEAQYDIGEMYEKGSGSQINMKKAFSWFEKAAAQHHIKAQFKVAYMYYKGQGVASDSAKAYKLMESPANEGNVRAQFYLGQMYVTGVGVKQDLDEAFLWYSRSSLGGYKPADDGLADLKKVMTAQIKKDSEKEDDMSTKRLVTKLGAKAKSEHAIAPSTSLPSPSAPKSEIASITSPASPTTATSESLQPAVQTQQTMANLLLNGAWTSSSKSPTEFLPSKITSCHKTSDAVIECLSEEQQRNIAETRIVYHTKAIVYSMKKEGEFKIAYRNNVMKIMNSKEGEDPTGAGDASGIKLGWQETEHRLECKIEGDQAINCVKNKTQKVSLKNQTML